MLDYYEGHSISINMQIYANFVICTLCVYSVYSLFID